jgi:hypothetical protein
MRVDEGVKVVTGTRTQILSQLAQLREQLAQLTQASKEEDPSKR